MSLFNHDTTHLAMVVAVCRIGEIETGSRQYRQVGLRMVPDGNTIQKRLSNSRWSCPRVEPSCLESLHSLLSSAEGSCGPPWL